MRPSISVTLEPGLERGVPWGRDLYTFVTSAAGHMMRTLQKPRKNRPSKRQVNHRRFLHNMIQRKFADIEAANHRLASALYFKEEEKNVSAGTHERSGCPSQGGSLHDPDKCSVDTDADGVSKSQSDVSVVSHENEISEKKQPDSGHLWKRLPKSQSTTFTSRKNSQGKGTLKQKKGSVNQKLAEFISVSSPIGLDYHHGEEVFHADYYENENLLKPTSIPPEDDQMTLNDNFIQNVDVSPSLSPDLSLLSLDSCDFSIQMFTDISSCTQAQKSTADITESQWTDIMDIFCIGSKDLAGCMDVEAYFESICACQGDTGADDDAFANQSDNFTQRICNNRPEMVDLHCERKKEYSYDTVDGYSCHGDQELMINHFQSDQRSSQVLRQYQDAAEMQFNNFIPLQGTENNQNQLLTSISYNISELEHPQEESPCMLVNCENNLSFMPFEGVAQSFSAPLHPEHHHIPIPPHEDDWLFTDILNDRRSLDC